MSWIKLHRRFLKWEWYGDHAMVILWIHLLLTANWEEKTWQGETVERGQIISSLSSLAEQTGLSVQQVRTCLKKLKNNTQINIQSTHKATKITICNYDTYQGFDETEQQTINTQSNIKSTTPKEYKNINIYNNISPTHTREDKPQENWRFISSVRRTLLGYDKTKIADFKAELFRQEVILINEEKEIGMTEDQIEAFIRWWTEHSPGKEEIKAEYEATFDVESRMRNWVERKKPNTTQRGAQKSRMDQTEENFRFIDSFYGKQQDTVADEQ